MIKFSRKQLQEMSIHNIAYLLNDCVSTTQPNIDDVAIVGESTDKNDNINGILLKDMKKNGNFLYVVLNTNSQVFKTYLQADKID